MRRLPLLPLVAGTLCLLGSVQQLTGDEPGPEVLAVLLGTAAVALSARRPVTAAAAVAVSVAAQSTWSQPQPVFASFLAVLAAAYALGRRCTTRSIAGGVAMLAAAMALMIVIDPTLHRPVEVVIPAVYLAGATAVGRVGAARERAQASAAEEQERRALAEQRADIAREMHDVVAHSLSLMVIQAEAAAALVDADTDRSRKLVADVAGTGRQALQEMRRALGVLRGPVDLVPQPQLTSIDDLLEPVRRSGTDVAVEVDEEARELADPGLQLTAYRIIQEAVTNAVRHAAPTRIEIAVRHTSRHLLIRVHNDFGCTAASAVEPGLGLVGMRERVRAYGGQVVAGPQPSGGWQVEAELPLAAPA